MPASKIGRSKAEHSGEEYRIATEVVDRIRRGDEDVLKAEDFWHGLDDLTYREPGSPAAPSEK
jgi:predicted DNA-binding protein